MVKTWAFLSKVRQVLYISASWFSTNHSSGRMMHCFLTYPVVNLGVGPFDITPCLGLSGISAPLPGSRLRDLDEDVELAVEVEISCALTLDWRCWMLPVHGLGSIKSCPATIYQVHKKHGPVNWWLNLNGTRVHMQGYCVNDKPESFIISVILMLHSMNSIWIHYILYQDVKDSLVRNWQRVLDQNGATLGYIQMTLTCHRIIWCWMMNPMESSAIWAFVSRTGENPLTEMSTRNFPGG
jgi:hypothetical protein